jgi:hypothetical protein
MIYDVISCVDIHGKSFSVAIALVCGSFECRLMQIDADHVAASSSQLQVAGLNSPAKQDSFADEGW